ncbi:hypothetical protein BDV18DRAFT_159687 [Aspergillus unguis]
MADTLDLLGVIGTWAAVLLAIIALAGIIPAYLLYRRSQTDEYEAISLIDDKHHEYVSKGIALLPGRRFFRSVRVPNLVEPPKLQAAAQDEPDANRVIEKIERQYNAEEISSATSWINFAHVLRAYGISYPHDGKPKIEGTQALLRVHRGWILLLGIIDRYGHRSDSGLFPEEPEEPGWRPLSSDAVYGLSGLLERVRPKQERIWFRMHSVTHMQSMPFCFPARDMSPRHLFFLYLGYLPVSDENERLYCSAVEAEPKANAPNSGTRIHRTHARKGARPADVFYRMTELNPNEVPPRDRFLAQEMGVELPTIHKLGHYKSVYSVAKNRGLLEKVQYLELDRKGEPKIWVHPSAAQSMVRALLQLDVNRQTFLCGDGLKDFFDQLLPKGDMEYLRYMLRTGIDLLQINAADKAPLKAALEPVVRHTAPFTESRTWASALERLDTEVRQLVQRCNAPEIAVQTMAILSLTRKGFMSQISTGHRETDPQPSLTILDKSVHVPRISNLPRVKYPFDFAAVFPSHGDRTGDERGTLTIPLWQVILASLHGHVRWYMWSTVFSASPLSTLHTKLEPIVYLSANNLPDREEDMGTELRDMADTRLRLLPTRSEPNEPNEHSDSSESNGNIVYSETEEDGAVHSEGEASSAATRPR